MAKKVKRAKGRKAAEGWGWYPAAAVIVALSAVGLFVYYPSKAKTIVSTKSTVTPGIDPVTGVEVPTSHKKLVRWDPVKVGHVRKLRLDSSERVYELRTLNMDPPIFEVEDFLSERETNHIMKLAEQQGLDTSDSTYLDASNLDYEKKTGDLTRDEAHKLFRYSDQTWLPHNLDKTMKRIYSRALKMVQVHPSMVDVEQLQVVKYRPWGHYECHHDSERDELGPCCMDHPERQTGVVALKRPLSERCALCRYITILHYLVDTEQGGGTVFPLANMTDEQLDAWRARDDTEKYKQTKTCGPGLSVSPKRGKAVIFYNHKVSESGHLGDLDERSLHGGCDVVKGRKWIANHWISALPDPANPRPDAISHY